MIEYFKYTGGEAFTLSGAAYSGFINVIDGVAYSGKSFSSSSKPLSSNGTFLANCFLNKLEFDRTGEAVEEASVLTLPEISPRNIIDQNFIDTNLGYLNHNNLNLYALNIISNTELLNFSNTPVDGDSYFLGLSSGSRDLRNDDIQLAKGNEFPIQIDPFSYIDRVFGVDVLDNTVDSTLFVYDDLSYLYFNTTSTSSSYTFSGSFVKGGSLTRINEDIFEGNIEFTYDNSTDILYTLVEDERTSEARKFFSLKLYDNGFISTCRALKLVDIIELEDEVIDNRVAIGNNIRGYRYLEGGEIKIKLVNKDTNALVDIIATSNPNEEIVAFDIRDTDDSVLIITQSTELECGIYDVSAAVQIGTIPVPEQIYYLYHLDINDITNLSCVLNPKVLKREYFDNADEIGVPTETVQIYLSPNDSNMFTLIDRGFVTTRFISNPELVAGFPSTDNLLYPATMYFGSTKEKFDKIEKKFNTNTLRSNYFNYINFIVAQNSTDLFYFLHTIGRIYLFRELPSLLYQNFVPLDLDNQYEKVTSCESSLGISLNSEIQNIIQDTVNIFSNLGVIPTPALVNGITVLRDFTTYQDIEINFRDLEFHENEEVNYTVISRVFRELYRLQKSVFDALPRTVSNLTVSDEEDISDEERTTLDG